LLYSSKAISPPTLHSFPTRRSSDLLDDQGLSGFDFDIDFFAGLQTIEKCGCGQNGHIRVGLAKFVVFRENVGIKQRAQQIVAARSEEHTSELQSPYDLVCRLLLEKK